MKGIILQRLLEYSLAILMASSASNNYNPNSDRTLLQRIQALDASRRIDVGKQYIPVLLVQEHDDDEDPEFFTIGHIHTDLIEQIRTKTNDSKSLVYSKHFLFPPPNEQESPPGWIRNRFFGLKVPKPGLLSRFNEWSIILGHFTDVLLDCGIISKKHTDEYPVTDLKDEEGRGPNGSQAILATINRNAAPYLGITSVGVHLLAYVRHSSTPNDVSLWLAQRAATKSHNALRWDPTVAGGQPMWMGLFENLVKEAGEEAGIDPQQVTETASSTGCLSQMTCKADGTCMKHSLYYTWDMLVDSEFVPKAVDGEVAQFELCSAKTLEQEVRHGNRLRPAMILVVTDFLIRHGVITPDNEPDYAKILSAMHQPRIVYEYQNDKDGKPKDNRPKTKRKSQGTRYYCNKRWHHILSDDDEVKANIQNPDKEHSKSDKSHK